MSELVNCPICGEGLRYEVIGVGIQGAPDDAGFYCDCNLEFHKFDSETEEEVTERFKNRADTTLLDKAIEFCKYAMETVREDSNPQVEVAHILCELEKIKQEANE